MNRRFLTGTRATRYSGTSARPTGSEVLGDMDEIFLFGHYGGSRGVIRRGSEEWVAPVLVTTESTHWLF